MYARVLSATVQGVDGIPVTVEVDLSQGLPNFTIVGLPEGAVKESKERVLAALKNAGFSLPMKRITVNLAPADMRKEGSGFDLPIALGILAALKMLPEEALSRHAFVGELALEGSLRPVRGMLPITLSLADRVEALVAPASVAPEGALVQQATVFGFDHLSDVVAFLQGEREAEPVTVDLQELFARAATYDVDFAEVKGQLHAKRALEIAAAGGHNVLMVGPPGSGKTMLARRLPTILPPLTLEEALEVTKIHSVAGLLRGPLVAVRPFRAPHHTISSVGLIGGGSVPRPGEVSLAHHGVLFLDELPEFSRHALEVLRQPLEDGFVTITRAKMTVQYPARFTLVAAMNPCPCGYLTDPVKECTCTPGQIHRYHARISGPLMDRIDLHIEVPALPVEELRRKEDGESSTAIRERVVEARMRQLARFKNRPGLFSNAQMGTREIKQYVRMSAETEHFLFSAVERLGFSARAYSRILKVARTIADLAGSDSIETPHVAEAIQYRMLDRKDWFLA